MAAHLTNNKALSLGKYLPSPAGQLDRSSPTTGNISQAAKHRDWPSMAPPASTASKRRQSTSRLPPLPSMATVTLNHQLPAGKTPPLANNKAP